MTSLEGVVTLDSSNALEFGTVELRAQTRVVRPTSIHSRQSAAVPGAKRRALRELRVRIWCELIRRITLLLQDLQNTCQRLS